MATSAEIPRPRCGGFSARTDFTTTESSVLEQRQHWKLSSPLTPDPALSDRVSFGGSVHDPREPVGTLLFDVLALVAVMAHRPTDQHVWRPRGSQADRLAGAGSSAPDFPFASCQEMTVNIKGGLQMTAGGRAGKLAGQLDDLDRRSDKPLETSMVMSRQWHPWKT